MARYIDRARNSCGIREFEGVGSLPPDRIMALVWKDMKNQEGAYITFSTRTKDKNIKGNFVLEDIMNYIAENKLGDFNYIRPRVNPNTSAEIGLLVWHYDKETLDTWADNNKKLFETPVGKKYRVIKDTCGHRIPIGTIVTVVKYLDDDMFLRVEPNDHDTGIYLYELEELKEGELE